MEAADALQVSRPAPPSLLNGKADPSGEMAPRIEKAFGVKMKLSRGCNGPATLPGPVAGK
jgi:plasmid maintenance system antidote protein VapI